MGEFSSSQSIQATSSSQTRQEPSVNVGNQDADAANAVRGKGRGRGRRTTIRVGKGAFPNTPPPTTPRMRSVGLKRGRGRESVESSSGQKRQKNTRFGCYINPTTGRTVINPGSSSERVVSHGRVMKDTSAVNIDLGFKLPSLKFRGRNVVTTTQLQQQARNKRNQICSSIQPILSVVGSSSTAGPAHPAP